MTKNQRSALAKKNGRAGGLARAKAMKDSDRAGWNALRGNRHQREIYGALFVNLPGIPRLNKARHEARVRGGQASQRKQAELRSS